MPFPRRVSLSGAIFLAAAQMNLIQMPNTARLPRKFFNSALWSLMGTVVPMFAALAAVPWLMHYMGQERLGVLSLVWVVVGYFSFLDMGLGRAVTVAVAAARSGGQHAVRMKYMCWGLLQCC